jgi:hypothetical protein
MLVVHRSRAICAPEPLKITELGRRHRLTVPAPYVLVALAVAVTILQQTASVAVMLA